MNTNIATLIMKNMAAAHRQLQNNMGDAFTTTLTSFRNYLKTTALWFVKSEDRWVEYGTCDVNGVTWTAEALFAYGYQEVMKVFKNADKAVFLQNISAAEVQTTAPTQMPFHPLQDDAMFNKQIYNLFAKHHINVTSITKQDGPWHMDKPWQIDTDRGSFLLNRVEGDYDNWGITPVTVAVQTEEEVEVETAPVQPAAVDFRTMVEGKTVKIRVNGKVYAGRVVGFKLDFPKVWVREIDTEIEFSRNAILRAVEGDRILEGGSETSVQPVETAPVATPVETAPVATPVETAPVATPVETKQSTNTHYYSPSKMVTNKKFDLEEAPGEFLAAVRDYFGEGAYRVKYVAPVITDIGKDYDGDDDFYQVLVVCQSGDQFLMTKPKWQTNWQVMPFHGEVKVGDYLLDTSVETTTQDAVEVDNSHSPVAIPVTDNEWAEDFLAEMESSSLTRVRIWVLLYRAGLRDYRVSKRRPEQLSLSDLVNLGELETNLIISPEGDEVWDAGWECWRERTQEFITSVKAKTEATDIEVRYADSKRGDVQCLFLSSSVEEDRQAVIMMLQNGFIDGWDTLHYHLNTYRMLSNPYELNGFGAALVTSATGTCHRVPFVITYGGLPFNQQAIDEYHNFLSRNW